MTVWVIRERIHGDKGRWAASDWRRNGGGN